VVALLIWVVWVTSHFKESIKKVLQAIGGLFYLS
jgi:hypothetical protein